VSLEDLLDDDAFLGSIKQLVENSGRAI
jgi:hypothetical protein